MHLRPSPQSPQSACCNPELPATEPPTPAEHPTAFRRSQAPSRTPRTFSRETLHILRENRCLAVSKVVHTPDIPPKTPASQAASNRAHRTAKHPARRQSCKLKAPNPCVGHPLRIPSPKHSPRHCTLHDIRHRKKLHPLNNPKGANKRKTPPLIQPTVLEPLPHPVLSPHNISSSTDHPDPSPAIKPSPPNNTRHILLTTKSLLLILTHPIISAYPFHPYFSFTPHEHHIRSRDTQN
ncbi:hypothetical protein [Encephalitozoon cuniculi GB-M1]|uniref:Uncharacterized protein ECU07_0030/ECU09_2040 n=1 Tax=Encephalitozoon cuniculi (strain GB-M1) TaxID=284813 RepID=Y703_ENCCU|nr:uncharacterized protein ECU09_2040 [Encephalitozoon cuniculi GB-M1]NP_585931.1 uncharacterized protein ECU07_0030 [Encephalitozoon cuniculi GB-M1]Q8ST93.1 RecName: Full=Uncharacterized protein ECU07_0030/ECU09_2040 [Encephalitozoon cuniculi GB-M1]CAD25535.1 hypothetical protein [Encephalitozoon cuniculi GB-M1]CAD27177.1 hypothetical protein [Encephalitozoon cuniculi GB-M1]